MLIDILFIMSAFYGFYLGYSRGIIQTVFSILSYVFGAMVAVKFAPGLTKILETVLKTNNPLLFIVSMLICAVVVMIFLRAVSNSLQGLFQVAHIDIINKVIGGVLLSATMILFYSTLLWFADKASAVSDALKQQSATYVVLQTLPPKAKDLGTKLKPIFHDIWGGGMEFMDRIQRVSVKREETTPNVYDIPDEKDNKK